MPNQLTGQELPGLAEVKTEVVNTIKSTEVGIHKGIRSIGRNPNTGHRVTETDQIRDLSPHTERSRVPRRPSSLPYRITGDSQRSVASL